MMANPAAQRTWIQSPSGALQAENKQAATEAVESKAVLAQPEGAVLPSAERPVLRHAHSAAAASVTRVVGRPIGKARVNEAIAARRAVSAVVGTGAAAVGPVDLTGEDDEEYLVSPSSQLVALTQRKQSAQPSMPAAVPAAARSDSLQLTRADKKAARRSSPAKLTLGPPNYLPSKKPKTADGARGGGATHSFGGWCKAAMAILARLEDVDAGGG